MYWAKFVQGGHLSNFGDAFLGIFWLFLAFFVLKKQEKQNPSFGRMKPYCFGYDRVLLIYIPIF
jgi:hypothetical protein